MIYEISGENNFRSNVLNDAEQYHRAGIDIGISGAFSLDICTSNHSDLL